MRLFFAIELPREVQRLLGGLRAAEQAEYRWVDPSLLHVTLAFLGNQPEERLPTLQQVGSAAASASQAAVLSLGQAGSFGPRREPRVLWIGLDGDLAALHQLQQRLAAELQREGFVLEDRPYSPHITLARRRERAPSTSPPARPPAGRIAGEPFTMDHLTLMESRLSPRGAAYTPLLEFPLGQAYSRGQHA